MSTNYAKKLQKTHKLQINIFVKNNNSYLALSSSTQFLVPPILWGAENAGQEKAGQENDRQNVRG